MGKKVFLLLILIIIISIMTSILGVKSPVLTLNENQILYLFSTSAQVLAGVYGLTLSGYAFLNGELSREEIEDSSLSDAIGSIKGRYFKLFLLLTVLTVTTFVFSNLTISAESNNNEIFVTVLINTSQTLFFATISLICYFIYQIIQPQKIERESQKILDTIDPTSSGHNEQGDLNLFLKKYNELEKIIQEHAIVYADDFYSNNNVKVKFSRIPNMKLVDILYKSEKINNELATKIKTIITIRNSIVHGVEPRVSKIIVDLLEKIVEELKEKLIRS